MEERRRLSRGSSERQTAQSQPSIGTPWEVPVPRKVSVSWELSVADGVGKLELSTVRFTLSTIAHGHDSEFVANQECRSGRGSRVEAGARFHRDHGRDGCWQINHYWSAPTFTR